MTPRRAVIVVAVASAVAARLIAFVALSDMAHVMDEMAYLFQAKLFARGLLTAPEALPRAAFNTWFVEDRGARFGIFPPGWPFVLAPFVRLGLTHWANPLFHGLTVILVGRAAERAARDRTTARRLPVVAALLYGLSPQALLLAGSLMSHTLVALAAGVVLVFGLELFARRRAPLALAGATGLAIGLAAATRPLCGVVLGVFAGVALLVYGRVAVGSFLRLAIAIGVAAGVPTLGLLAFNKALTGHALRFPQMAYFDEHLAPADLPFFQYRKGCNDLGLGPGHACDLTVHDAAHTLGNALSNLGDNMTAWLLLACGPVLVVGLGLSLARRASRPAARLLLVVPLASMVLYALYWHGGTCFGARFYQSALPATLLVVALGLVTAPGRFTCAALLAGALLWDGFAMRRSWKEIADPVWGYWAVDDRFRALKASWTEGPAIVMVAFGPDDLYNPKLGWTAIVPDGAMWMLNIRALAALAENPPDVREAGDVLFAKFHPALAADLAARYPGRRLFLYVSNGARAKDTVKPYDPAPFASRADEAPPDNFDGFRVEKPALPPPKTLAPPRPYWP